MEGKGQRYLLESNFIFWPYNYCAVGCFPEPVEIVTFPSDEVLEEISQNHSWLLQL